MTSGFSRVGSANAFDTSLNNVLSRQTSLTNLQAELTSGKKVVQPSDDPTGAAAAERAVTRLARIATDQRALASQRDSISQGEGTLGSINDALQSFRELAASAGNASYGPTDRKSIASQLQGFRDQVFALANSKDTNGLPLFGALGSAPTAFVGPQALPQDYTFSGLPGQTASNEVSIPNALDGNQAFMFSPTTSGAFNVTLSNVTPPAHQITTTGATVTNPTLVNGSSYSIGISSVDTTTVPGTTTVTYDITETPNVTGPYSGSASYPSNTAANIAVTAIPGVTLNIQGAPAVGDTIAVTGRPSIFSILDDAINNIGGAVDGNAAQQAVGQALNNIDLSISQISAVRGQAGNLLNRADTISSDQDKRSIQVEADRSSAEDLDMIKGVSDFQNQQTGYQAALQSYAQVQKLSLFNYLS